MMLVLIKEKKKYHTCTVMIQCMYQNISDIENNVELYNFRLHPFLEFMYVALTCKYLFRTLFFFFYLVLFLINFLLFKKVIPGACFSQETVVIYI